MHKLDLSFQSIRNKTAHFLNNLEKLGAIDICQSSDKYEEFNLKIALQAEQIACAMRKLIYVSSVSYALCMYTKKHYRKEELETIIIWN